MVCIIDIVLVKAEMLHRIEYDNIDGKGALWISF